MKKLRFLYVASAVLFGVSLLMAVYLSWRDGVKPGPWMLAAGLFFLHLLVRELRKNK